MTCSVAVRSDAGAGPAGAGEPLVGRGAASVRGAARPAGGRAEGAGAALQRRPAAAGGAQTAAHRRRAQGRYARSVYAPRGESGGVDLVQCWISSILPY